MNRHALLASITGLAAIILPLPAHAVAAAQTIAAPAMTPALPGLTSSETVADAIWRLRAGLNVAALQCQFSPFLQTVPTYNALLRQHSDEMAGAFKAMTDYFRRQYKGRAGERAFDSYATRTNQSWATFDAQLSFCEEASKIGKRALALPKGRLGEFATAELSVFRHSLSVIPGEPLRQLTLEWISVPDMAKCRKRC